ncbi:FecR domain-containing protein [Marinifilum sp.]|uniref:FecR family protein n=1 Tax=Marinifilum sp. TaxID=2033137 RepID=UPI003BABE198
MKKNIEKQIRKADQYAKSILKNAKDDSGLSASEKEALLSIENGRYQSERERKIKIYLRKENWKRVEKQIKEGTRTPIVKTLQFWYSAAAILLLIVLAGGAYLIYDDFRTNTPDLVQPGSSMAYLEVDGIEVIDLGKKDTTVMFDKLNARIDSGKITYSDGNKEFSGNDFHKIIVPRNAEYDVVLPDGTKVWINSESIIGFQPKYSSNIRIVELKGEAYFEVAKDSLRPFIVRTNDIDVRVLGTHFNVKAYGDEEYTYATLSEGKIILFVDEKMIEMKPDEQVVFNKVNREYEKNEVDASIYTAWKDGKFIFRDEPLENIMSALSRWYDIEVFYPNQDIKDDLYSMRVNRYDDIEVLLQKMEKTGALSFTLNKKALVVE